MHLYIVFLLNVVFTCGDPGAAPLVQLHDGFYMPTLALGTWLGNSSTGRIEPLGHEVENAVIAALEAGYRHVDTAWSYKVEDQVGRAVNAAIEKYEKLHRTTTTPATCDVHCYLSKMKDNIFRAREDVVPVPRKDIFVTTKLWNDAHARPVVLQAVRASLQQLKLGYIDLYLMHWPLGLLPNSSYDYTSYIETWKGMMDAQALGYTRSIGVSNFNQVMLENIRAHHLAKPAVLQIEWNLNLQQPDLLAYCRRHNITVMGYTPFGSLLPSRAAPGAPPPRIDDPRLKAMAEKHNKTVPQIVLRYAVEMGVTPIPKSLKPTRIAENINVFHFKLDDVDKVVLRSFDVGYRTVPQLKWRDHPYYPFERAPDTSPATSTDGDTLALGNLDNNSSRVRFIDIGSYIHLGNKTKV